MRIYCQCNICTKKVLLSSTAKTRHQLANSWGTVFSINCLHCGSKHNVHINNVCAESSRKNITYATAGAGSAVGIIAGPLGVLIGLSVGVISGGIVYSIENKQIQNFNKHYL